MEILESANESFLENFRVVLVGGIYIQERWIAVVQFSIDNN